MRNEAASKPFPVNLFDDLEIPVPEQTADDFLPTLMYILRCVCSPRDSKAFLMRYKEGKTFDEIGEMFELTKQRAHYMIQDILCRFNDEYLAMLSKGIKQYYVDLLAERMNFLTPIVSDSERELVRADAYKEGYEKGYADASEGMRQSAENADSLDKIYLDNLGLSVRLSNCCKKAGLHTLGDVLTYGDKLMGIDAFGKTCFHEISVYLGHYGVNVQRAFPRCVKKWGA